MHIDTVKARQYLSDNFNLDGTAFRLCAAVFEYWNNYCSDSKVELYLTELLDPIGFNQDDVSQMITTGIIMAD